VEPAIQLVAAWPSEAGWLAAALRELGVSLIAPSGRPDVTRSTILCVRDPRAATHALPGGAAETLEVTGQLELPVTGPSPFGLPALERWAFQILAWLALAEGTDVLLVRLEDVRSDPARQLGSVLDFLGRPCAPARTAASGVSGGEFQGMLDGASDVVHHVLGLLGYEADAPSPDPVVEDVAAAAEARARLGTDGTTAARDALIAARAALAGAPAAIRSLACALAAIRFTEALVGRDPSAQGARVFDAVYDATRRFADVPAVDAMLIAEEMAARRAAEVRAPFAMRAARLRDADASALTSAETAALFAAGNYAEVARTGDPDAWQTHAALGLVGKTEAAVAGLARFAEPEARFHVGVAHFIAGDDDQALRLLEPLDDAHAQRLAALVRKPQIHILAQLPWRRSGSQDYLGAAVHDGRFVVQNLSFAPGDLANDAALDVLTLFDRDDPPDLYVASTIESHLLPPNLQALPCPLIGHTADYDMHVQTLPPWLRLFDELVVSGHTEWADVRRLAGVPVSTFPKCVGVPTEMPVVPRGPRQLDAFLSGSSIHPFYGEKAQLIAQLLAQPELTVRIVDGHLPFPLYATFLGRTKVAFTQVRRPGSMPLRGLESLAMGAALVSERAGSLALFLGEEDGVLLYDARHGDFAGAVTRILDEWPEWERRARWGAAVVRDEFALDRVTSELLRFLTFLAARPRTARVPVAPPAQRQSVVWKGWMTPPAPVAETMLARNLAGLLPRLTERRALLDGAREMVLTALRHPTPGAGIVESPDTPPVIAEALALYRCGVESHPASLAVRLNAIRTAVHHGSPGDVAAALALAADTLAQPHERWQLDPDDDVFPFDFAPGFFNYRTYLDLVTDAWQGATVETRLVPLALASIAHYLGCYTGDPTTLEQAVALDGEFPFYRLSLARTLADRGRPADTVRAAHLAAELASGSVVLVEALELLAALEATGVPITSHLSPAADHLTRARDAIVRTEDARMGSLRRARVSPLVLGRGES
jgi:hypothetical protein